MANPPSDDLPAALATAGDPPRGASAGHRLAPAEVEQLGRRLGGEVLERRLEEQRAQAEGERHQFEGLYRLNRWLPVEIDELVGRALRASGLYPRGNRNFKAVVVEHNTVSLARLPAGLDGLRLLHLSDLHLDLDPGLLPPVVAACADLDYDFAVITGDYRDSTVACFDRAVALTAELLGNLRPVPVYGVLGNHDFIEMVPALEAAGLRVLLNEAVPFAGGEGGRGAGATGETIYLAGVDDPVFYRTHDLGRAARAVPAGACSILLSHTPATYREAAERGFDLVLSGHTHGGQICLPGGVPIVRNARVPPALLAGPWEHGGMSGYTSRGTGGCGVAARFFCPPEVTVHTLRAGLNGAPPPSTAGSPAVL